MLHVVRLEHIDHAHQRQHAGNDVVVDVTVEEPKPRILGERVERLRATGDEVGNVRANIACASSVSARAREYELEQYHNKTESFALDGGQQQRRTKELGIGVPVNQMNVDRLSDGVHVPPHGLVAIRHQTVEITV